MDVYRLMVVFLACFAVAMVSTLAARRVAHRFRIYDYPNDSDPSKYHKQPVPLLGGLGVWLPILLCGLTLAPSDWHIWAVVAGATVMTFLGLVDDLLDLSYWVRLIAQSVVILGVMAAGINADSLSPVWLSRILSFIWLIGLTNAFNLMDNLDGAAIGITGIISVVVALLAVYLSLPSQAYLAVGVSGAAAAFFLFNRKPATIYLGSAGSFCLGFVLASLCLLLTPGFSNGWFQALALPVLMGFPIFDTTMATLSRLYYKRPLFTHDASCTTYRFFRLGMSREQAVRVEHLMALIYALFSWIVFWTHPALAFVIFIALLVVFVYIGYRLARLPGSQGVVLTDGSGFEPPSPSDRTAD